jgi:ankyrin repeat protein
VRILLEANAHGAQVQDKHGCLPLHVASRYGASQGVVRMLLDVYRNGAQVQDKHGCLPLHDACYVKASPDVMRLLIDAYPDGAQVKLNNGLLPLQYMDTILGNCGPDLFYILDDTKKQGFLRPQLEFSKSYS